jgi:hypothetical protein
LIGLSRKNDIKFSQSDPQPVCIEGSGNSKFDLVKKFITCNPNDLKNCLPPDFDTDMTLHQLFHFEWDRFKDFPFELIQRHVEFNELTFMDSLKQSEANYEGLFSNPYIFKILSGTCKGIYGFKEVANKGSNTSRAREDKRFEKVFLEKRYPFLTAEIKGFNTTKTKREQGLFSIWM